MANEIYSKSWWGSGVCFNTVGWGLVYKPYAGCGAVPALLLALETRATYYENETCTIATLDEIEAIAYTAPVVPTGLLADYPNAAVAYSLRNLISTTTNVVRVRRSNDQVEQDFTAAEITDGTLTTFTGANDGFVTIWYDQSGNSNNLVQGTALNQPKIVDSGTVVFVNNKPSIEYIGANVNFLEQSTVLSISAADGFIVVKTKDYPANALSYTESGLWGYSAAGAATHYSFNDGNIYDSFFTNSRKATGTPAVTLAQLNLYNVLSKSGEWTSRLNSTQVFTTLSNTVLASNPQYLALNMESGLPDYPLNGYISEFIIYPSDQSANRSGIETNVNAEYTIY